VTLIPTRKAKGRRKMSNGHVALKLQHWVMPTDGAADPARRFNFGRRRGFVKT
jgi:hypothetical protein